MPNARERIVVEDDEYGRLLVRREPAAELEFAPVGWRRGLWEDERRVANDVEAEYIAPGRLA